MRRVNRSMRGLSPASQIKGQPPAQADAQNLTCGILAYKSTDGTYDYYEAQSNGCVYVYLLDQPGGNVVSGYPAQCQAKGTLGVEIPYQLGCDCAHP
jgi:hypothetical protein